MSHNQLYNVQQAFKHWRMNKKSGELIPEALWDLVHKLILSQNYKPSVIGQELGISSSQLKRKFPAHYPCRAKGTKSTDVSPKANTKHSDSYLSTKFTAATAASPNKTRHSVKTNFVEAPLAPMLATQNSPTLTLQRPNGTQLTLEAPPKEFLDKIFIHFIQED